MVWISDDGQIYIYILPQNWVKMHFYAMTQIRIVILIKHVFKRKYLQSSCLSLHLHHTSSTFLKLSYCKRCPPPPSPHPEKSIPARNGQAVWFLAFTPQVASDRGGQSVCGLPGGPCSGYPCWQASTLRLPRYLSWLEAVVVAVLDDISSGHLQHRAL